MSSGSFDFDLAVLGAGPAGSACALRAADLGLSVLLCDPQQGAWDKPCGEGILPAGVAALRTLGIAGAPARRFERVRHCVPEAGALDVPLSAPGEAWWRPDLQAAFAAAIADRPRIMRHAARGSAQRIADGFHVAAGPEVRSARALAVACGAGAALELAEPRPSRRRPRTRRSGARLRFEERRALDGVEVHFGRGFDVYLTPLPRGFVNVVVLHDAGRGEQRDAADLVAAGLAAHPDARACLGAPVGRAEGRALGQPWPRSVVQAGAWRIGDAGGAVDPILGAGLTVALRTGLHAAQAAAARAAGEPADVVARRFVLASTHERRARRALAAGLRFLALHDACARTALRGLRRAPAVARALARIAAGAPESLMNESSPAWATRPA